MVGPGAYAVTGGTGALGLCVARRLVEEGAKVPVADPWGCRWIHGLVDLRKKKLGLTDTFTWDV
jgi:NAD(P)-dependent dehydrogenase (short-subunit alcohol dehydrogenase family)